MREFFGPLSFGTGGRFFCGFDLRQGCEATDGIDIGDSAGGVLAGKQKEKLTW